MKGDVLDAVIAPGYEPQALEMLKGKKKGTFLILRTRGPFRKDHGVDMVRVLGGVLLQTTGFPEPRPESFKVVTKNSPAADQMRDGLFGITVSRYKDGGEGWPVCPGGCSRLGGARPPKASGTPAAGGIGGGRWSSPSAPPRERG